MNTLIQTISNTAASAIQANNFYMAYKDRWKFLLESYMGGEEYRQAGHLTRYQLETAHEYQARLNATPLDNHCKSVISVYNSFLFRTEPTRDYGSQANNPDVIDFLRDADFEGRSLDNFMKDVSTWSNVFGHCWVLMVKPDVGAVTRADEVAIGVRPYVNLLTPLSVLDWQWERSISGRYTLSMFKYVEDINGDLITIRTWTPTDIVTTQYNNKDEVVVNEFVEPNGLGKIPAVVAYANRSTVRGMGISSITDIADAQKFIYNATSEVDQSIRLDSHPSLVKTPETNAGVGAGAIIHMPENLDPGLKPYVLDFAGANVDSIYNAIQRTIDSIDKMANTGAIRATESRTLSGVAMETEFSLLNAKLSEMADNMELAEEQMWRLWCEYQQVPFDMTIDYPGSFNIRDTASEIQQLATAANTNPADPRVKAAIDVKILDWLDLDEDELAAMADLTLANPNTIAESGELPPGSIV